MNLLLYDEIRPCAKVPNFGPAFRAHIDAKRHPGVYSASLSAWTLLEKGLKMLGLQNMPQVDFSGSGKPYFIDADLHFSLSHSAGMAAVIISDQNCGIDVELVCPDRIEKLRSRVLSAEELAQGRDFFEIWTKKEAIAKLTGTGLPARPCEMDISGYENLKWHMQHITDGLGREYCLHIICEDLSEIKKADCV